MLLLLKLFSTNTTCIHNLELFHDGRIYLSEIRRFIYESFIPLTPVPLFDLAN